MTDEAIDHDEAARLLPWLANGTLDAGERERVERHVRTCVTCRAELAEQRALAGLVRRQPAVRLSAERDFERLRRALDARPRSRGARRRRTAAWAAAASVAIAVLAAVLVGVLPGTEDPDDGYRTLTEDGAAPMLVDVVFADIAEEEIHELIARHGAVIVAGPSPRIGRYTLRVAGDAVPETQVAELVRRLREDERVRFAARAYSVPSDDASGDPEH